MFTTRILPRVSETDAAGHINNVFVSVWFEAGRREIFRILNPDLDFLAWRAVIVNINVDYENQLFFAHEVEIRTWVKEIGNRSFKVGEEIWQQNQRCASGTAVYVYFNPSTQSAESIPVNVADKLRKQLID